MTSTIDNPGDSKLMNWICEHLSYPHDYCLIWPFGRTRDGYGTIGRDKKNLKVHRLICSLVHGASFQTCARHAVRRENSASARASLTASGSEKVSSMCRKLSVPCPLQIKQLKQEAKMSHHGSDPFGGAPERKETFKKLLETTAFRGATGEFPEGQLNKTDEGAIQFAIGVKDGKVILDFGTPVAWVGMNPQQAADVATLLVRRAREAARQTGEVISFTIG